MIVDVDFQIISGLGWMELMGNTIKTRQNGTVKAEDATPAILHLHDQGATISLPPKIVQHLRKCIQYEFTHDQRGNPLPEPEAKSIRVVIRV